MICKKTGGDGRLQSLEYTPKQKAGYTIKAGVDIYDDSWMWGGKYDLNWFNRQTSELIASTYIEVGAGETKHAELISVMPNHTLQCNLSLVEKTLIDECNDYKEFTIALSENPEDPEPKPEPSSYLWLIVLIVAVIIIAASTFILRRK